MNHNKHRPPRKENDRRPTLPEWLAVKLDIPADVTGDGLRLDMRGRHTLTVHGCRKIVEYRPDRVRLQMKSCYLLVRGCRLICVSYLAGAVELEGQIDGVCFENEEEDVRP